ncbi:MAG: diaminopimelate decarboxylase [Solobacterium sp.]|nr:diaminopimelate decarboxylase [Solobacterium sp.]
MSEIGGMNILTLAQTYGTPLAVYDEGALRDKLKSFTEHFRSDSFKTDVVYASKAFNCMAMIQLIEEYGCCLDVVSGGELYTAYKAGYDCSKIFFHGNNKTPAEIKMALDLGVGTIVLDNEMEAAELVRQIRGTDKKINAYLRVNPGIEAHTHKYIVTAHVDSKFGISMLDEEDIVNVIRMVSSTDNITFEGIHAHIGSQIFDKKAYSELVKKMFAFASKLKNEYGFDVTGVNLGGGFAAYYTDEDHPIPVDEVCAEIIRTCEEENAKNGNQITRVLIEPGRSIVAEAGYNLYTIGYIKKTPNKLYAFVDGGMSDNIRPALYQAKYDAFIAGKENDEVSGTYTIAGKCCESGDILIQSIALPEVKTGDILVMKTTGAYGYSMASHYNKLPLPAVVFVKDGTAREVIERETYEHLISLEKQEVNP